MNAVRCSNLVVYQWVKEFSAVWIDGLLNVGLVNVTDLHIIPVKYFGIFGFEENASPLS